jgi:hypothetical protein
MVRCNRQSPCSACTNTGLRNCLYVCDDIHDLAKAPFEAGETQFSVFEQTLLGLVASYTAAPSVPVPHAQTNVQPVLLPGQYDPFDEAFQHVHRPLHPSSFDMPLSLYSSSFDMPMQPDTPSLDLLSQTDPSTTEPRVTVALYPSLSFAPGGAFYKGRFLAQSHWINYAYQVSELSSCTPYVVLVSRVFWLNPKVVLGNPGFNTLA